MMNFNSILLRSLNLAAFQQDFNDICLPASQSGFFFKCLQVIAIDKRYILVPASNSNPKRECVEMMDVFFSWTEMSAKKFSDWFGLLSNVLAFLYPEAFQSIGFDIGSLFAFNLFHRSWVS